VTCPVPGTGHVSSGQFQRQTPGSAKTGVSMPTFAAGTVENETRLGSGAGPVLSGRLWSQAPDMALEWRLSSAGGYSSANRGKEVVRLDRFQYGQWRYQRVEACPRDLRGIA